LSFFAFIGVYVDSVRFAECFLCQNLLWVQAYGLREGFQHLNLGETRLRSNGKPCSRIDIPEEFKTFRLNIVVDACGVSHHVFDVVRVDA